MIDSSVCKGSGRLGASAIAVTGLFVAVTGLFVETRFSLLFNCGSSLLMTHLGHSYLALDLLNLSVSGLLSPRQVE